MEADCLKSIRQRITGKRLSKLLIVFLLVFSVFSDIIYIEKSRSQADLKVFVTKVKSQADFLIHITESRSIAKNKKNIWYISKSKSLADLRIYYVDSKSQADITVYFVNRGSL